MSIKPKVTRGTQVDGCIFTRYQNMTQAKVKKFISSQHKKSRNSGLTLKNNSTGLLFLGTGKEMIKVGSKEFVLAEIVDYKRPTPDFDKLLELGYDTYYDEFSDEFKCLKTLIAEFEKVQTSL